MDVLVPNGLVQLAPHGDYTVWIDGEVTRVLVYGGEARVSASGAAVNVGEGRLAEIDAQAQVHPAVDRQVPLLANSDFGLHDQNWAPYDKPNIPGLDVNGQRFWVAGPRTAPDADRAARWCVFRAAANTARRASPRSSTGRVGLPPSLAAGLGASRLRRPVRWRHARLRVPDDAANEVRGPGRGLAQPVVHRVVLRHRPARARGRGLAGAAGRMAETTRST